MAESWKEAAKGIPVRENGRVCRVGSRGVFTVRMILPSGFALFLWQDGVRLDESGSILASEFFPNLADPYECAAYDRRLALALGAPDDIEGCYVVAYGPGTVAKGVEPFVLVMGRAGFDEGEEGWAWSSMVDGVSTDDRLLARALAWPADKRVKS